MLKLQLDQVHSQISQCAVCIHGRVDAGRPVCGVNSAEIKFFDASYGCPKGLWRASDHVFMYGSSEPRIGFDAESQVLWLNKADPRLMGILDAGFSRIENRPLCWALEGKALPDIPTLNREMAYQRPTPALQVQSADVAKKQSFWRAATAALSTAAGMAAQFAVVTTSGRASDEDIATRRASCAACPSKKTNAKGEEYCGDCGCGENRWSILDRKLEFAKLPCPRGQPGFYST